MAHIEPAVRKISRINEDMTKWQAFKAWILDDDLWVLTEDYWFEWIHNDESIMLYAPEGFKFDGASIPKIFRVFISPSGIFFIPGLFHDYAYRNNCLMTRIPGCDPEEIFVAAGRGFYDKMFRDIGRQLNRLTILPNICYAAIRSGGWVAWNNHRKKNGKTNH